MTTSTYLSAAFVGQEFGIISKGPPYKATEENSTCTKLSSNFAGYIHQRQSKSLCKQESVLLLSGPSTHYKRAWKEEVASDPIQMQAGTVLVDTPFNL